MPHFNLGQLSGRDMYFCGAANSTNSSMGMTASFARGDRKGSVAMSSEYSTSTPPMQKTTSKGTVVSDNFSFQNVSVTTEENIIDFSNRLNWMQRNFEVIDENASNVDVASARSKDNISSKSPRFQTKSAGN